MNTVIVTAILQGKVFVIRNEHDMPMTWKSIGDAIRWTNSPTALIRAASTVMVIDVETGETHEI